MKPLYTINESCFYSSFKAGEIYELKKHGQDRKYYGMYLNVCKAYPFKIEEENGIFTKKAYIANLKKEFYIFLINGKIEKVDLNTISHRKIL
jgi:hypothetical protein